MFSPRCADVSTGSFLYQGKQNSALCNCLSDFQPVKLMSWTEQHPTQQVSSDQKHFMYTQKSKRTI